MAENPAELLIASARRFGDKPALVTEAATITYGELLAAAQRFAGGLRAAGCGNGDRVSLFSANRWEWVAAYHGALLAGCVVNPVNSMLTGPELAEIVNDCGARVLVASAACLERIGPWLAEIPTVTHVIGFDGSSGSEGGGKDRGVVGFAEFGASSDPVTQAPESELRSLRSISYTSGTTGRAKGAMQSAESLLLNWAYTASMHVRSAADVVLTALPLSHVYGNVAVNSTLMVGGTVVLRERFNTADMLGCVSRHRVSMIEGVPTMYAMMLDSPDLADADLTSVTRSTVGGQTIPLPVIERWEAVSGAPLLELWGMTELSGLGTTHAAYAPALPGSIGVALPGTEVRVADLDDATRDAAEGSDGELMVRGPLVTLGYFGNAAATAETVDPDGWLHTGDIARRTGQHFFVVDRRKDMIITGGFNIYPAELERVLSAHPDVALVAVGKVPDERLGEVPHAFVVAASGVTPDLEQILAYARSRLAAYKVPRAVHVVEALPMTASGKVKRRELVPPAAPATAKEGSSR